MRDQRGVKPAGPKASRLAAALALSLAAAALPSSAKAQAFGGWGGWDGWGNGGGWGGMGPGEIYQSIAERGFRVISPLRRNGAVFVADVVDRRGRRERLVVAAADASIVRRFYLDDPRLPGFVPRDAQGSERTDGRPAERADRGDDPVPPAIIPGIGSDDGATVAPVPRPPRVKPARPQRARTVDRTPADARPQRDLEPAVPAAVTPPGPKPAESARAPSNETAPDREATRSPAKATVGPDALAPAGPAPTPRPSDAMRIPGKDADKPADRTPVAKASPGEPAPAAVPATSPRMSDPLRIPGADAAPDARPARAQPATAKANPAPRAVAGTVTGAPAAKPAPSAPVAQTGPAKPADVPVAPLD